MLLSLYAGCGGLDLGFEDAGYEIGLAYDWNSDAVASWKGNRSGQERGHVADLRTICIRDMDRDFGGTFMPSAVIGGPPCQGFSRANHLRHRNDSRNALFRRFFTVALRLHRYRGPLDFILAENVPELEREPNAGILGREIERLATNGFDVRVFALDAARYSVPQRRKRLFVLALPSGSCAARLWKRPRANQHKQRTVRDAIEGLPDPTHYQRGLTQEQIPYHCNHWCMRPKSRKFFDGSLLAGDLFGRSFKTLSWDAPSVTVAYGHREVHVHPGGRRRLSVFEAMRLQGFPDEYVLKGNLSSQISQVSEAVPPPLAKALAESIRVSKGIEGA